MRTRFELGPYGPMTFNVSGEEFSFRNTTKYAEIGNVPAGIVEEIRKTRDGRFLWLTVIGDEGELKNSYGYGRGWYSAQVVSEADAEKMRESWAVLRPQPVDGF